MRLVIIHAWFGGLNNFMYRASQLGLVAGGAYVVGGVALLVRGDDPATRTTRRRLGVGLAALGVAGGVATFAARDELGYREFTAWTLSATTAGIGAVFLIDARSPTIVPQKDGAMLAFGGTF
jgi:hypothetical protein